MSGAELGRDSQFKLTLGFVAVFLFGATLSFGFVYLKILPKLSDSQTSSQKCNQALEKMVPAESLPVDDEILTNPIVYEWNGGVKGKIVNKDAHTFTLEDEKGNKITITDIIPTGEIFKTIFRAAPDKDGNSKVIPLSEIPIGTTLRGNFWIFGTGKKVPVGGMFFIVK